MMIITALKFPIHRSRLALEKYVLWKIRYVLTMPSKRTNTWYWHWIFHLTMGTFTLNLMSILYCLLKWN